MHRDELALRGDFGFSQEHELLRRTARRLLAEQCSMAALRRWTAASAVGDGAGLSEEADGVWRELGAAGWPGLIVGEAGGGAGLDHLSLALVMEELGRALAPAPLLETVLAAAAIERSGDSVARRRWLPALASGALVGTVGLGEGGSWEPEAVAATARRDGDGFRLDGRKVHVGFGGRAGLLVAPFRVGSELALFAIELGGAGSAAGRAAGNAADSVAGRVAGLTVEEEVGVDPTRPAARIGLADVRVPDEARLPGDGGAVWRDLFVLGWAMLAAEAVGAAEAILSRTRDYAVERVQFGRPIGSFQAVKHPIVDVMIAVEQARSLAVAAAAALDAAAGSPARAAIPARMAKAAATDALRFAADRGVQLHGGYGFTWDCDAHFFMKRALWTAATLGDAVHHRRHLAAALLDPAGDAAPSGGAR